jgi:hypothetical protein
LKTRFGQHCSKIRNNSKINTFLYKHFKQSGHTLKHVTIQPLEKLIFDNSASRAFKIRARLISEHKWIQKLQTPYPLGLNDNIYQEGNISKNPDFDIFDLLEIRKRKSRSHGIRTNGNIKRKSRVHCSIHDLQNILKHSGRHAMLSRLASLSISSLQKVDKEADDIVIRTHPLYEVASLTQCYTRHVLRPHIDLESDHQRHFLKISFLNKGIDFIDLPSIFKDKTVESAIPNYFKNTETPIVCYKYNRPTRNTIFNYNKITSDLQIVENTPTS